MAICLRKPSRQYNYAFFSLDSRIQIQEDRIIRLYYGLFCKHYMTVETETIDCILQLSGHDALFYFMVNVISQSLLMTNVIC